MRITLSSLAGKTPADVLSAMQLLTALPDAPGIVVAVRGGRGRQIVLNDVPRRVIYHHARQADPHALASAQPGDSIRLVPGASAEATIAVVPISGPSE